MTPNFDSLLYNISAFSTSLPPTPMSSTHMSSTHMGGDPPGQGARPAAHSRSLSWGTMYPMARGTSG